MGDGHAALLDRMLELDMATFLSHLEPPIPLKNQDYFPAFHIVYKYTLNALGVNRHSRQQVAAHSHFFFERYILDGAA